MSVDDMTALPPLELPARTVRVVRRPYMDTYVGYDTRHGAEFRSTERGRRYLYMPVEQGRQVIRHLNAKGYTGLCLMTYKCEIVE